MAFKVSPLAYKKYAGVLCGLAIQVGLMLGTVFQLGYSAIFGLNWSLEDFIFRLTILSIVEIKNILYKSLLFYILTH
jgi:hypothetical protein